MGGFFYFVARKVFWGKSHSKKKKKKVMKGSELQRTGTEITGLKRVQKRV